MGSISSQKRRIFPHLCKCSRLRGLTQGTQDPHAALLSAQKHLTLSLPTCKRSKQTMQANQLQLGLPSLVYWSSSTVRSLIQHISKQTQSHTKLQPVLQRCLRMGAAAPGTATCQPFPGSRSRISSQLNFLTAWMGWKDIISLCKDGQRVMEMKLPEVSIKFRCLICSFKCCPAKSSLG